MTDRPILFSGAMVRAILDGRKTMTRRLADSRYVLNKPSFWRKVRPGDTLWVRENLRRSGSGWVYAVDDAEVTLILSDPRVPEMIGWAHHKEQDHCPSIHMPRWASRITLEVTAVRIERLQDITEDDARAEGVEPVVAGRTGWSEPIKTHRTGFVRLWNELHGASAWLDNPEVVAISFIRATAGLPDTPEPPCNTDIQNHPARDR